MENKEFTREQLDVLADLVLREMDALREFGNSRPKAVKEALTQEIGALHTLYNYLIV